MRSRALLGILSMSLAIGGLLAQPGFATADDFAVGPPNSGYKGDSSIHTFCFGAGFDAALQNNANWAMGTSLDRDTDITDQFDTTCAQGATDVEWLDANLPAGVRGAYACQNMVNANTCNHAHVTLDPAEINIGSLDEEDTSKTACHEAGHSVGLTHGAGLTDCMRNGEIPNALEQYRTYNGHHIFHIDSTY